MSPQKLQEARKKIRDAGFSVKHLAYEVGVTTQQLYNILCGRQAATRTRLKIASVLGLSYDELWGPINEE